MVPVLPAHAAGLKSAKRRCRRETLARRSHLPGDLGLILGALALSHLFGLPEYKHAKTVLAFASFRGELDTRPLLADVLRSGRVLVLPVTDLDTRRLDLRIVSSLSQLRPGRWDIPEPSGECPPADRTSLDLVIVPGVAFDTSGQRVGYGGGFYDGLLRDWRTQSRAGPVACGLAYELQVRQLVPSGTHDQPLDLLVTETGVRRFREA